MELRQNVIRIYPMPMFIAQGICIRTVLPKIYQFTFVVGLITVMAKMSWRLSMILVMGNYILWLPKQHFETHYKGM